MKREILPDEYRTLTEAEAVGRVRAVKNRLGPELCILTHHYQRREIIELGDFRGDSFLLSKRAAEQEQARYIVFCGVHFMAESAAILARPDQAVFIPDPSAGCPMADMAAEDAVQEAWQELGEIVALREVAPVCYVNSSAAVKAFCGRNQGATCTSSNADQVFAWAFKDRGKIFFLPDEHLGRNTAAKLGVEPLVLWDPKQERGGLAVNEIETARVIGWKGFCHVHTHFTVEHVREKRAEYPGCKVVVHPECPREVVEAADAAGSTEWIIRYAAAAPEGSAIVVGTEIHLVERLAREHGGKKTVVPLARSLCPNMYRINLINLCWVLESLPGGPAKWVNRVEVAEEVRRDAGLALKRMLEITK